MLLGLLDDIANVISTVFEPQRFEFIGNNIKHYSFLLLRAMASYSAREGVVSLILLRSCFLSLTGRCLVTGVIS